MSNKILQRKTKITRADALELAENSVRVDSFQNAAMRQVWKRYIDSDLFLDNAKLIKKLGEPLVTMPDFESNPGLWMFSDIQSGITFMVWSDCHRKNAFKGTSFEVLKTSDDTVVADLAGAFTRLIDFFCTLP